MTEGYKKKKQTNKQTNKQTKNIRHNQTTVTYEKRLKMPKG